jgi:hypothetical protein
MIAQSNNPLPTIPQLWKGDQFIYYFNHKDNGVQKDEEEGRRYTAEVTIIDSLDKLAIERAVTRALADPELDRCVTDNIEVEAKPAIQILKSYKLDTLVTSKIATIMAVIAMEPIEEKPVEIIKKKS